MRVVELNLEAVAFQDRRASHGIGEQGSQARMLKPALEKETG